MKNLAKLSKAGGFPNLVAALLLTATGAAAEERISAFDFGLSIRDYVGKSVTVEGCQFVQATLDSILCRIVVDKKAVGNFWIDTDEVPRDVLKSAILECAGLEDKPECQGNVTGTLEDTYGEPRMMKATIVLAK